MFPAGAGVILESFAASVIALSVPRRCGGDPGMDIREFGLLRCSPQVRG